MALPHGEVTAHQVLDEVEQMASGSPLLEELAGAMRDASICGLGQAAANPLTSLVRHFPGLFPAPAALNAE